MFSCLIPRRIRKFRSPFIVPCCPVEIIFESCTYEHMMVAPLAWQVQESEHCVRWGPKFFFASKLANQKSQFHIDLPHILSKTTKACSAPLCGREPTWSGACLPSRIVADVNETSSTNVYVTSNTAMGRQFCAKEVSPGFGRMVNIVWYQAESADILLQMPSKKLAWLCVRV